MRLISRKILKCVMGFTEALYIKNLHVFESSVDNDRVWSKNWFLFLTPHMWISKFSKMHCYDLQKYRAKLAISSSSIFQDNTNSHAFEDIATKWNKFLFSRNGTLYHIVLENIFCPIATAWHLLFAIIFLRNNFYAKSVLMMLTWIGDILGNYFF